MGKKNIPTAREKPGMPANARKAFAARYRKMMAACLEQECHCRNTEAIIQDTVDAMARLLPHYRYRQEEEGAFHCYLRKMLRNRTVDAGKGWTVLEGSGRSGGRRGQTVQVTDELVAEVREFYAVRDAATGLAVQELENATKNKEHWQIFYRTALLHEKPAGVAKSLEAGLAKVYQTKKRMTDRFKAIAFALYGEVGLVAAPQTCPPRAPGRQ
jgi:DNA-directed RNA polymerase specialized sigma24 family protein